MTAELARLALGTVATAVTGLVRLAHAVRADPVQFNQLGLDFESNE